MGEVAFSQLVRVGRIRRLHGLRYHSSGARLYDTNLTYESLLIDTLPEMCGVFGGSGS